MAMSPSDYNEKRSKLQESLLIDMEIATEQLRANQEDVVTLGKKVMTKLNQALRDGKITAYKAAMAYGKIVDTRCKVEKVRMDLYDRVSGVAGLYTPGLETAEEEAAEGRVEGLEGVSEEDCRREASRVLVQLLDRKRKRDTDRANEAKNEAVNQ